MRKTRRRADTGRGPRRPHRGTMTMWHPRAGIGRWADLGLILPLLAMTGAAAVRAEAGILPLPGIYRVDGVGQSFELSAVTPTAMTIRHWQTETPQPPPPESGAFFSAGSARLLEDGVTWRMLNRDQEGYCCGNAVELEFRVLSPTTLTHLRYRLWPLTDPQPGPESGWMANPPNEFVRVGPVAAEPTAQPPEPVIVNGKVLVDSGVRFSSLSGQVEVYHEGQSPRDATFAKMGTVLYEGDHIITSEDSSAILGFADLSTYLLKAESHIVLTERPAPMTKLGLVAGNIWVNVKKMAVNGTMEIDMSQAVAGIKGTVVVFETQPATSTVKVFEGVVNVVSTHGGPSVDVAAGFMVTATASGLGPVVPFATDAERATWETLLAKVPPDPVPVATMAPGEATVYTGAGTVTQLLQASCAADATGTLVLQPDGTFVLTVLTPMMDWDCTPDSGDVQWTLEGTAGDGTLRFTGCNDPETYRSEGSGTVTDAAITLEARCIDVASRTDAASFAMELGR